MNAGDAIAFMLAGASCVQIGTANFINPSVTTEIINGIYEYCSSKGISDINDIIGKI